MHLFLIVFLKCYLAIRLHSRKCKIKLSSIQLNISLVFVLGYIMFTYRPNWRRWFLYCLFIYTSYMCV